MHQTNRLQPQVRSPLTRKTLHGVWCALILPWTDDDEVDPDRFARECRSYGETGVHGIYTGGTTGEFYAQDDESFEAITRIACEEGHAVGLPVQIGCTALSTRTVRRRIRVALRHAADGIQVAYPFWLELKPDEVLSYLRDIAQEAGDTPIILYHTGRAKRKLSPDEIGALADAVPTFIGMKDTGCDIPTLKAMFHRAPDLAIFGGEDFYDRIPHGGRGGYCSITGLNAKFVVDYYSLCAAGKLEQAKGHHITIKRLLDEALLPLNRIDGLWDSAIDRVQRVLGGGEVGLRCQAPYRSATTEQVERVRQWCLQNAPFLLPEK
jgi:dihydrodipicolinate synthase/N-acetylneuraminate lyase